MQVGRKAHADYGGIPLIPHNWHNGLMTMANAHMVAALPGIDGRESLPGKAASGMLELNMRQGPLQWEILREKPAIEDGYLILPDAPGLGVELADDIETRFPYIEGPWGTPIQR
jgi:L-alanine-DL-glutamate epimerase-like enolase superfamily enzyme